MAESISSRLQKLEEATQLAKPKQIYDWSRVTDQELGELQEFRLRYIASGNSSDVFNPEELRRQREIFAKVRVKPSV